MKSRAQIKEQAKLAISRQRGGLIGVLLLATLLASVGSFVPMVSFVVVPVLSVSTMYIRLMAYTERRVRPKHIFFGFENFGRNFGTVLLTNLITMGPYIIVLVVFYVVLLMEQISRANIHNYYDYYLWSSRSLSLRLPLLLLMIVALVWTIVASLIFWAVPYVLADSKNSGVKSSLKTALRMMKGNKGRVFVFQMSFFGWAMAGIFPMVLMFISIPLNMPALTGFLGIFAILAMIAYYIVFFTPYMGVSYAGLYLDIKEDALRNGSITAEEFYLADQPVRKPTAPTYPEEPPIEIG